MSYNVRVARSSDVDAIARIHVASWRANYRGMIPDEVIESRTVESRHASWQAALEDPQRLSLVAESDDSSVVGFAGVRLFEPAVAGFGAYLQTLYVDDSLKRSGIGRLLLRAVAGALIARGISNLALRTLAENPARRFYERLGARLIPEGLEIDESDFCDVVYAFDDLSALSEPAP